MEGKKASPPHLMSEGWKPPPAPPPDPSPQSRARDPRGRPRTRTGKGVGREGGERPGPHRDGRIFSVFPRWCAAAAMLPASVCAEARSPFAPSSVSESQRRRRDSRSSVSDVVTGRALFSELMVRAGYEKCAGWAGFAGTSSAATSEMFPCAVR